MNIKQSTNNDASAQKLNQTIMKEIENRVQISVVKKFAIMDDEIDKVFELINKLEQTTCTELNEIKSLLYQVRNESRTCSSQQTQTMHVASESDEERVEPQIDKSFDLKTCLSLETSFQHSNETSITSTKTIIESSTVHAHDTSNASYIQYKDKLPDPLKSYISKTNLSLNTSRISLNQTILAAERSQPTKAMPNPPTKHGQPSSFASDGETKGKLAGPQLIRSFDCAEKSKPTSSGLKPSLLHALKHLNVSKATSKPSGPAKIMPQAAATAAASLESISVASIKENRRQNLNKRIFESSESSLTVSKRQNTNGGPQQKCQEVVADLSICHAELLDLFESYASTFIKNSEITGTRQKLIHDIRNKTTNEYMLLSDPVKKNEYNTFLSPSKPEPYELFDFLNLKICATSTPVRRPRPRPVPLPRSGSKNSSVTNNYVPYVNQ